jgi:hypothetical protein
MRARIQSAHSSSQIQRIKEGTPDDFGDTGGGAPIPGRQHTLCVGLTLKNQLKSCRNDEVFFKVLSTPECRALRSRTAYGP